VVRVYYRSTDVVITDEVFAIRNPVGMRFRIDRLHDAHIVSVDQPVRFARGVIVVPIVAIIAGAALQSFWGWTIGIAVAVVAATVMAVRRSRTGRVGELRASYGGLDVMLFRSTNAAVFGQVRRALGRALENRATVSR